MLHLAGVNEDTVRCQNMPQKLHSIQPKFTLAKFSIQLVFPQSSQYYPKVLGMLFLVLGIYQDIFNEYLYKLV